MKSTIIRSLMFLLGVACMGGVSQAQEVAILDVAKVFKENQAFDAKMKAIRDEAEQLKASITAEQEKIKQEAQPLQTMASGTPQRMQLESTLAQKQTSLRTRAAQAEAQLLNREARVYHETYLQMQSVVEELAPQLNLVLVLRFDSAEIDPNNRPDVIKGVNRSVVFYHNRDLTKMVIDKMAARVAQAPTSSIPK